MDSNNIWGCHGLRGCSKNLLDRLGAPGLFDTARITRKLTANSDVMDFLEKYYIYIAVIGGFVVIVLPILFYTYVNFRRSQLPRERLRNEIAAESSKAKRGRQRSNDHTDDESDDDNHAHGHGKKRGAHKGKSSTHSDSDSGDEENPKRKGGKYSDRYIDLEKELARINFMEIHGEEMDKIEPESPEHKLFLDFLSVLVTSDVQKVINNLMRINTNLRMRIDLPTRDIADRIKELLVLTEKEVTSKQMHTLRKYAYEIYIENENLRKKTPAMEAANPITPKQPKRLIEVVDDSKLGDNIHISPSAVDVHTEDDRHVGEAYDYYDVNNRNGSPSATISAAVRLNRSPPKRDDVSVSSASTAASNVPSFKFKTKFKSLQETSDNNSVTTVSITSSNRPLSQTKLNLRPLQPLSTTTGPSRVFNTGANPHISNIINKAMSSDIVKTNILSNANGNFVAQKKLNGVRSPTQLQQLQQQQSSSLDSSLMAQSKSMNNNNNINNINNNISNSVVDASNEAKAVSRVNAPLPMMQSQGHKYNLNNNNNNNNNGIINNINNNNSLPRPSLLQQSNNAVLSRPLALNTTNNNINNNNNNSTGRPLLLRTNSNNNNNNTNNINNNGTANQPISQYKNLLNNNNNNNNNNIANAINNRASLGSLSAVRPAQLNNPLSPPSMIRTMNQMPQLQHNNNNNNGGIINNNMSSSAPLQLQLQPRQQNTSPSDFLNKTPNAVARRNNNNNNNSGIINNNSAAINVGYNTYNSYGDNINNSNGNMMMNGTTRGSPNNNNINSGIINNNNNNNAMSYESNPMKSTLSPNNNNNNNSRSNASSLLPRPNPVNTAPSAIMNNNNNINSSSLLANSPMAAAMKQTNMMNRSLNNNNNINNNNNVPPLVRSNSGSTGRPVLRR